MLGRVIRNQLFVNFFSHASMTRFLTFQTDDSSVHLAVLIVVPIAGVIVLSVVIILLMFCFCKKEVHQTDGHQLTPEEMQGKIILTTRD